MDKKVDINNDKKKKSAIIISVLVLMACIIGFTYAYFALTATNDNTVTGTVGGSDLTLTVSKVFPDSTAKMIPQLEDALSRAISEEYSCVDDYGNVICQVYEAVVTNVNSTVRLSGTISFSDIEDIPNLKWKRITDSRTIGEFATNNATTDEVIFEEEREFTPNETVNYYFVVWLDETGELQEDVGTFKATVKFGTTETGITSTITPLLTNHIKSLYNSETAISYHIAGDQSKQEVILDSSSGIMYVDQGDYGVEYRYYGATPNNYVRFNGELWRIISSSTVYSSESDTTGETRVRIIKDTPIGNRSWDYNGSNNWTTSTLNTELNGIYYNRTSGICYNEEGEQTCDYSDNGTVKGLNAEARNLIDDALWYLGGGFNSDLYADDYYTMERGTAVADSSYPYRWTGKVGIMYPSDYAYAADLSQCKIPGYNYESEGSNCATTDWLFNSEMQWLMSPDSSRSYFAWFVYGPGCVYNYVDPLVGYEFGVRPLAVLKSDVRVMSGKGTRDKPYTLIINE